MFDSSARKKTWRKLSALYSHKIPERHAIIMLRDRYQAKKSPLAKLFTQVIAEIDTGASLDVAFSDFVPAEELLLIRSGIKGNRLPQALDDCVEIIDSHIKIKGAIRGAVAYPILLTCGLITLLLALALFVMPELAQLSEPALWTGAAGVLYSMCQIIASPFGAIILMAFIAAVSASIISMPLWTGKSRLYVEEIPPWSIYRLMTASVWLFTLATLLRAGISLDFILSDMLDGRKIKPWLRERIQTIAERLNTEGNFGILLQNLDLKFPDPELVEELGVYATLPRFDETLYTIAKEWLDEGVERILKQANIIKGVLLLAIISVLCLVGISVGSIQKQLGVM
jgi:type II secretory pathway component PulF